MSANRYTVEQTGPRIDAFLRPVIDEAGFRLQYEIVPGDSSNPEIENPEVTVKFSGPDVDLLLANRAELLLALEHVTMEALHMPSDDHSRLSFDANDYRLLRIEELRLSAAAAAEKVKRSGAPFRFSPMNSRERRVVHLTLRNETELRSESSGQGPHRHVVIYPAGMASLPDPPAPAFGPRRAGGGGSFERRPDRNGPRADGPGGRGGGRSGGGRGGQGGGRGGPRDRNRKPHHSRDPR